jgi:hypothetical protein
LSNATAKVLLAVYDPEVEIHEAASLPYGGVYQGHEGAVQHGAGYLRAWDAYQGEAERALTPAFLEVERDKVLALWRQRAVDLAKEVRLDLPASGIYELRAGGVVRAQMFQDTAAVLRFLNAATRREPVAERYHGRA